MTLTKTVELVEAVVADLDELIGSYPIDDLADALDARAILNTTSMGLAQVRERLDGMIAEAMGQYEVLVEGRGVVRRHKNKRRRNWQSDDLLRVLLDTRTVDPDTGEIESQLDMVKRVYGLKGYNASLTQLKARGISADEFCEEEDRGWKIEVR